MKIIIVTDAWLPQINGVVRTLQKVTALLQERGHDVKVVGPDTVRLTVCALPSYPEIRLEFFAYTRLRRLIVAEQPDYIHIATEGPLGWAARRVCLHLGKPFTTSFHTRFPEYLAARAPRFLKPVVHFAAYAALRRFHAPASAIMVATRSIEEDLRRRKFRHIVRWSRGVDNAAFSPTEREGNDCYAGYARPVLLYVGRVAVEKNLRAFLGLNHVGSKIVIGDGPDLAQLRADYPDAHFLGAKTGTDLARHYAAADLFVFPSKTDTFGLVLLEACASGLRIAAVPAPGPADIFADPAAASFAALDADLGQAVTRALALPADTAAPCVYAARFSWDASASQFFDHLQASTPQARRRLTRLRKWLRGG